MATRRWLLAAAVLLPLLAVVIVTLWAAQAFIGLVAAFGVPLVSGIIRLADSLPGYITSAAWQESVPVEVDPVRSSMYASPGCLTVPDFDGLQVRYLASAAKPLRTAMLGAYIVLCPASRLLTGSSSSGFRRDLPAE